MDPMCATPSLLLPVDPMCAPNVHPWTRAPVHPWTQCAPCTRTTPGAHALLPLGMCLTPLRHLNPHRVLSDPGFAAFQFAARYSAAAGLYMAAYDTDGHTKQFDFSAVANTSVSLELRHLRPHIPASSRAPFETPYDVVIGTFTPAQSTRIAPPAGRTPLGVDWGGWRAAADMYKDWAVAHAPWTRHRLMARTDLPSWLLAGTAAVIVNLCGTPAVCAASGYDNATYGPHLEALAPMMASYRAAAGLPSVVAVLYGWEHNGLWAAGGYFPPRPSAAALRAASDALHAQGDHPALLISGYWFMRRRQRTRYGPAFDQTTLWEAMQPGLVVRSDGQYAMMRFPPNATSGSHHGDSYRLCHTAPTAASSMEATFDEALGYAPMVSFDQEMGGAADFACFNTSHGHAPGRGHHEWDGYRDTLAAIRTRALSRGREVALMQEQASELGMPYLGAYWTRQFWQVASQGADMAGTAAMNPNAIDAVNVGAFAYMYHEHALGLAAAQFQGQGELAQPGGGGEPYQLRALVIMSAVSRGLMPAPFAHDVNDTRSATRDEWHVRVASANAAANRAWAAWAPDVLAVGVAVMPPRVDGPVLRTHEAIRDAGGVVQPRELVLSAVQFGSFLVPGQQASPMPHVTVATVLLNPLWSNASLAVHLPWRRPPEGSMPIELRCGADRKLLRTWPGGGRAPLELTIVLGPLEAAVLLVPNVTLCGPRPCVV